MAEIWDCTNEEYHADCDKIGSSMLRTVLSSPARYRAKYIDKTILDKPSSAKLLGSCVHCLVLEPDEWDNLFCLRPDVDGRTKAGKEVLAKFAVSSLGKTEVKPDVHERAKAMANAVLSVDFIHDMIETGIKERAIVWEEHDLMCKCRPDIFVPNYSEDCDLILDLKTTDDPTPEKWASGSSFSPVRKYRYDLQGTHYAAGAQSLTGRSCVFGIIAIGSEEPHDVYVYDMTAWLSVGNKHRDLAFAMIRQCGERGWRRPEQTGIYTLQPNNYD